MNQKIDDPGTEGTRQGSEFTPDFVRLLVALTITTLILVFVFEHTLLRERTYGPHLYLFPWVVAGGHTISNGLAEFSGHVPGLCTVAERMAILLSAIIGFIVGPTLFFFGWYYRRKERAAEGKNQVLQGSGIIFTIGAILTLSVAIPSIPIAFIRVEVERSIRNAQAVQSEKDFMINELNTLRISAIQHRVLPHEYGGGFGSYAGYVIPQERVETKVGKYSVVASEGSVTFLAISVKYPSATIRCSIDGKGEFIPGQWKYSGKFQ